MEEEKSLPTQGERERKYQVLVDVADEGEQADLLKRLQEAKFKCRPLIF